MSEISNNINQLHIFKAQLYHKVQGTSLFKSIEGAGTQNPKHSSGLCKILYQPRKSVQGNLHILSTISDKTTYIGYSDICANLHKNVYMI